MELSQELEEPLFTSALALPACERGAYLRRACGGQPHLYSRVITLLEASADAAEFLDRGRKTDGLGDEIEDFTLIREIGEGGGGVVYLAKQQAPINRHVALKVLKAGMDTRAVISRFEIERQVLAMMDHPNIACVFDAGVTSKGRPYFVMELVRGIRITDYCNQSRLTVSERLDLFAQVCQAIQHAHSKGVIHRDIKPSNVLVTLHGGNPIAKVIDFGIAKATQPFSSTPTVHTALDQWLGTPAYMSPEQIRGAGVTVDTRSDLYSLGVLLYELLTGQQPFDAERRVISALRPGVEGLVPPSLSKALRGLSDDECDRIAAARQVTRRDLMKRLQGDLNWIVMRCLEPDPERRYGSVSELALDLRRYARHEAIAAHAPSVTYLLGKFARRHRFVLAMVGIAAVALSVATALSLRSAVRTAAAERVAREVIAFLEEDLLAQASPIYESDRNLTLRRALDNASDRAANRFANQPAVEAAVRETLGSTYESLGEYQQAATHLTRSFALYKSQLGIDAEATLRLQSKLASTENSLGNYFAAERLAREALDGQTSSLGQEHPDTLRTMVDLAEILLRQGSYEAAERLQLTALPILRRVVGERSVLTLEAMHELALTYSQQARFREAEQLQELMFELHREIYGLEHPWTLQTMTNLADTYGRLGRFEAAQTMQVKAVELATQVLGPEHPDTLLAMSNLGATHTNLGRWAEGADLHERVLAARTRLLGREHVDTATSMNNLALAYRMRRQLIEAEGLQREAFESMVAALGEDHPSTLAVMYNLAAIRLESGHRDEATTTFQNGLVTSMRVLGPGHLITTRYACKASAALNASGRFTESIFTIKSVFAEVESTDRFEVFVAQSQLGESLMRLGHLLEAEPLLRSGLSGIRAHRSRVPAVSWEELDKAASRVQEIERLLSIRTD